jgi:hypothetical protein
MHRSDYTRMTIETRPGFGRRTGETPARRPDEAYVAELIQARHEQVAERLSLAMLGRRRGPLD